MPRHTYTKKNKRPLTRKEERKIKKRLKKKRR